MAIEEGREAIVMSSCITLGCKGIWGTLGFLGRTLECLPGFSRSYSNKFRGLTKKRKRYLGTSNLGTRLRHLPKSKVCPIAYDIITASCYWQLCPGGRLLILASIARARAWPVLLLPGLLFAAIKKCSLTITRISKSPPVASLLLEK